MLGGAGTVLGLVLGDRAAASSFQLAPVLFDITLRAGVHRRLVRGRHRACRCSRRSSRYRRTSRLDPIEVIQGG